MKRRVCSVPEPHVVRQVNATVFNSVWHVGTYVKVVVVPAVQNEQVVAKKLPRGR